MRSQNPQCFKGFLTSNNNFHAFFRYKATFLSGNRMKELISRFDEKYGPQLAASEK